MAQDQTKTLIIVGIAAIGAWYLYEQGYLYQWTGIASLLPSGAATPPVTTTAASTPLTSTPVTTTSVPVSSTPPSAPPAQAPPAPAQVLSVADAAVFPYSSSVTSAQINSIHDQLVTELQGGQIPQIGGGSVLAYMLGWGGAASGATQTVLGDTYKFDGSNWNLVGSAGGAGTSGIGMFFGNRVPTMGVHGMGFARVRRGAIQ
jgi:hypothetical protein